MRRTEAGRHIPAPLIKDDDGWGYTLVFRCRYCNRPIQRRGLLRRWRYVLR